VGYHMAKSFLEPQAFDCSYKPSEAEKKIPEQLADKWSQGDTDALAMLWADNVKYESWVGIGKIRSVYQEIFDCTTNRKLVIRSTEWTRDPVTVTGEAMLYATGCGWWPEGKLFKYSLTLNAAGEIDQMFWWWRDEFQVASL
ncbi:hypothetical protein, partial [Halioglobus sp. HI00S01]|uniref:hypothetical protein n=3 Tax=Halioglobus sp. HI00S01 TaxID=1822214 RepID=UPI001E50A120